MMYNGYRFVAPEYAALINPIACNAFAMRCEGRADIKARSSIATGNTLDQPNLGPFTILDTQTEDAVCDAKMFITPFVELWNDVTLDYGCRFVTSKLTFSIDGELVIQDSAINNHLLCPACLIARQPTDRVGLLLGCECELGLLGMCQMFFLPNGTKITATLADVPTGGGDLQLNAGVILAQYTTKVRQGCLFGVGALDAQQQAYPVTYPCPSTFGAAPAGGEPVGVSGPAAGPAFGPGNLGGGPPPGGGNG
jgi:hypothetical protein